MRKTRVASTRVPAAVPSFLLLAVLLVTAGCSSTPPETLYSGYLSSLGQAVRVESLLLFEARKSLPEPEAREYRTTFQAAETRYIYGELRLRYPGPRDRDADLSVVWVWTDASGGEIERAGAETTVEDDWIRSYHVWGCGSEEAGEFWEPGRYRLDLFADGELLASQPYRVE